MTLVPLPEGYGLSQPGDLRLPFAPNVLWTPSNNGGFDNGTHTGIDWATCVGAPVHAMAAGRVVRVVNGFTYGHGHKPKEIVNGFANYVLVYTGGFDDPLKGFAHIYAHLAEVHVCAGQPVASGDLLGVSGDTGWSTAAHLHVEVKPFNTIQPDIGNPHGISYKDIDNWHGHTVYQGAIDFCRFPTFN